MSKTPPTFSRNHTVFARKLSTSSPKSTSQEPESTPSPKPPAAKRGMVEVAYSDMVKTLNGPKRAPGTPPAELLTFDPGTLRAGIAHFQHGDLVFADVVAMPDVDIGQRVVALGRKLKLLPVISQRRAPLRIVVEFPEVYPPGSAQAKKVNPRDILWVSAAVGAVLTALPHNVQVEVIDVNPKTWKGNLSKDGGNDVAFDALFPAEQALLPKKRSGNYDDNMLDAVGIGLHHLKRMRGG